jgi:hypothetical protein
LKTLFRVYFTDAMYGWVVGGQGTILSTKDGGAHWNTESSGTGQDLHGVWFANPSVGWAEGNGGANLVYHSSPVACFLSRPWVVGTPPSHRRAWTFAGTFSPARSIALRLTIQRWNGRQWKPQQSMNLVTSASGQWLGKVKFDRGTYRLRTWRKTGDGYLGAMSGWRTVSVK